MKKYIKAGLLFTVGFITGIVYKNISTSKDYASLHKEDEFDDEFDDEDIDNEL